MPVTKQVRIPGQRLGDIQRFPAGTAAAGQIIFGTQSPAVGGGPHFSGAR